MGFTMPKAMSGSKPRVMPTRLRALFTPPPPPPPNVSSKYLALSLLLLLGVFAFLVLSSSNPVQAQAGTDYDTDDDGLIEISSLAQLNAVRYDLDGDGSATDVASTTAINEANEYAAAFPNPASSMGCPAAGCEGYELRADLDFDENDDGTRNDTYNTGSGWDPIGSFTNGFFEATFEGNGHTVSNLFISRSATDYMGLFGETIGTVRNLGLADADVTGQDQVGAGALAGYNNGIITASWASGSVTGTDDVGGLVGENGFLGKIIASHAAVSVTGTDDVGGLAGHMAGGNVAATYATGSVTGTSDVGGLVGFNTQGAITASYAAGSVSGATSSATNVGGLLGGWNDLWATVTASYHDSETTGRVFGIGGDDNGSGTDEDNNSVDAGETNSLPGRTTAELKTPTGYTGIYSNWNLDLDDADGDDSHSTGQDDPWDFGSANDYPILKNVGGALRPPSVDYDSDDDGLIEISSLAQLNAVRYDLDGNGAVTDDASTTTIDEAGEYAAAFPNSEADMGCPDTGCEGYELTAGLDFDEDGDGTRNDTYNTGSGWDPIGDDTDTFSATFEGNGYTITNLFMNRAFPDADYAGLFGGSSGTVRNLGLADVDVTGGYEVGALVGRNDRGSTVAASWATGSVAGGGDVGGLVGYNGFRAAIAESYAAVSVSGTDSSETHVGGLVGQNSGGDITASYATGSVTGPVYAGGLVGIYRRGAVTASYATGSVSGTTGIGGLIGSAGAPRIAPITDSYHDSQTTGRVFGIGSDDNNDGDDTDATDHNNVVDTGETNSLPGKTTSELQTPTGYTGIYADWNLDLDDADDDGDATTGTDDPWDFGSATDYPTLRYAGAADNDYDADNDGLIEISSLAQLNAVRYDLDGNGAVTDDTATTEIDEATAHAVAFPNPASSMGCPAAGCDGYELTVDLDFDTGTEDDRTDDEFANVDDMGTTDTSDDVVRGWFPLGDEFVPFSAVFEGNGHSIFNLFINRGSTDSVGLFGESRGTLRNIGLANADVTGRDTVGALVGRNDGAVTGSWASGSVTGRYEVGGLVGRLGSRTTVAESYAAVNVTR